MKRFLKITFLLAFLVTAVFAQAQTPKFGHIDLQALIQVMPERAEAEKKYSEFENELETVLNELQTELQTKYMDYLSKRDSLSETQRRVREEDLNSLNERVQTYQVTASQQIQAKQAELLRPVFDKADSTIQTVANEQGLIYVFDISSRVVLYHSTQSIDLLPLVKAKMGI